MPTARDRVQRSPRKLLRTLASLGFLALAALVGPGWASAATVGVSVGVSPENVDVATLTYEAGANEANRVAISADIGLFTGDIEGWLVRETGLLSDDPTSTTPPVTLTPGPECSSLDAHTVFCSMPVTEGGVNILVELGDLNDVASIATACGHTDNTDDIFGCNARVNGGDGVDELVASDVGASVLDGQGRGDVLYAGESGSTLYGRAGPDWLFGAAGGDVLRGGDGPDYIADSSGGRDRMWGGNGNDTFRSRDGRRDVLRGGYGRDCAQIDRHDVTRSIERFFSVFP
jgi:hypothetical protein